ncbi:hypothetical protein CSHISOI_08787 [Colletotrichum shisoi]|uniref:Uncharacterized protein n=1 Tax=Colletotrichum shisoi TaxID=2078593 RepID=A0A5Q4BHS4_9PEZI|nr:hypothetical protein CSHISOI_08787 [Colletotrichum shisoi]
MTRASSPTVSDISISLGHEEPESYLRPVTAACQSVYNASGKAARPHGIMSLESLDRDLGRSVTVSSRHEAGPGSRAYGLRNSLQTTPGAASPFRSESEPELITNPETPIGDVTNSIAWDQTMTHREFEYSLGDNSFDLFWMNLLPKRYRYQSAKTPIQALIVLSFQSAPPMRGWLMKIGMPVPEL